MARPRRIEDLGQLEDLDLSADYVHSNLIRNLPKDERWTKALPELLSDFSSLLRDTFDLMRELGTCERQAR